MSKKFILGITLAMAMGIPAYSNAGLAPDLDQQYEVVSQQGDQTNVEGDWVDSKEVNTVQESELTRKEIQAQKAKNAAENDKYGGAVTLIAMCIIISALIILSVLFLIFGKISTGLHKRQKRAAHGVSTDDAEEHHDEVDSGETIAAIAMALAEHLGQGHDIQDTILTIRRLRKAYSPWNSKIYNLRSVPEINNRNAAHHRKLK